MPHVCEHRMDEEFYLTWSSNNRTNSGNTIDLFDTQQEYTPASDHRLMDSDF